MGEAVRYDGRFLQQQELRTAESKRECHTRSSKNIGSLYFLYTKTGYTRPFPTAPIERDHTCDGVDTRQSSKQSPRSKQAPG